jgi:myo-inositol-1(or 4)-monophosphatase
MAPEASDHRSDSSAERLVDRLADELLVLALALAAQAAAVHREGLGRVLASTTKSSATDVVTEVDHRAEAVVLEGVRRHRPGDGYVGEEGADVASTTGVVWIVDPLDGTTNYVYGFPAYSVSIGVVVDGRPLVGVVHDSARDEIFHAVAGRGAFVDGRPIAVSERADLATALVATGFGYDAGLRRRQADLLPGVVPRVRDIRRSGSCAIDLCWTACGRVDAYYEHGPADWDVTAGMLIAQEAGARCHRGEEPPRLVLAATPGIFDGLSDLVAGF